VAGRTYPGWTVKEVYEGRYRARSGGPGSGGPGGSGGRPGGPRRPADPTATIVLERGGQTEERLFNPYTGADLGEATTSGQWFLLWVTRLHDDLLLDRPDGPWWNGLLSLAFTLSVITGGVVWWPGVSRWKRSLGVKVKAGWRRFNWDLHSALGFWLFFFMLMWGISGWYLGMPDPLTNFVERISDPDQPYGERPGDLVLQWLPRLHFGRWRDPVWGPWLKAVWAVVGVVPAALFVTGLMAEQTPTHVTLARVKGRPPESLPGLLSESTDLEFGGTEIDRVVLYQSELGKTGPKYTVLSEHELG
jgi:hypothetical protein